MLFMLALSGAANAAVVPAEILHQTTDLLPSASGTNIRVTDVREVVTFSDGTVGANLMLLDRSLVVTHEDQVVASDALGLRPHGSAHGTHYAFLTFVSLRTHGDDVVFGAANPFGPGIIRAIQLPRVYPGGGVSYVLDTDTDGDTVADNRALVWSSDGTLASSVVLGQSDATVPGAWPLDTLAYTDLDGVTSVYDNPSWLDYAVTDDGAHWVAQVYTGTDFPTGLDVLRRVFLKDGLTVSDASTEETERVATAIHSDDIYVFDSSVETVAIDGDNQRARFEDDGQDVAVWGDCSLAQFPGLFVDVPILAVGDELNLDGDGIGDETVLDIPVDTPPGALPDDGSLGLALVVRNAQGSQRMAVVRLFDVCCPDPDGDGVCTQDDQCEGDDGIGDTDGDGVCDDLDPCPNAAFDDADGDGVCDDLDVCVGDDGVGDSDGDGACDDLDVCPLSATDDADNDGTCDDVDLCEGDDASGNSDGDTLCNDRDLSLLVTSAGPGEGMRFRALPGSLGTLGEFRFYVTVGGVGSEPCVAGTCGSLRRPVQLGTIDEGEPVLDVQVPRSVASGTVVYAQVLQVVDSGFFGTVVVPSEVVVRVIE